jgi:hypothetical protein
MVLLPLAIVAVVWLRVFSLGSYPQTADNQSTASAWLVGGAIAVSGIGLILLRRWLSYRYDPNEEDLALRKAKGRISTLREDELNQILDERKKTN